MITFDDYPGFQQIPGMPIPLQHIVALFYSLFIEKMGRYGKETYGNVWDVEKMSMPHIRRKTGKYARPYGQTEYLSKGRKYSTTEMIL